MISVPPDYNQVMMCSELGFPNFQKGEPINKLMMEIKREVKKENMIEVIHWYVLSLPKDNPNPKTINVPPPIDAKVISHPIILPIDGQPLVLLYRQ